MKPFWGKIGKQTTGMRLLGVRIAILQVVKSAQGLVELEVWTDLLGSAWAGAGGGVF